MSGDLGRGDGGRQLRPAWRPWLTGARGEHGGGREKPRGRCREVAGGLGLLTCYSNRRVRASARRSMGGLSSVRKQGKMKVERGGRRARLGLCAATAVAGSCAGASARLNSIYRQPKAVRTGKSRRCTVLDDHRTARPRLPTLGRTTRPMVRHPSGVDCGSSTSDGTARAEAERCAEHPAVRGHGTGVCCNTAHGTGEGHA